MRHIFSIIFLLCFGMIADAEVAEFDSASYVLGDVIIRSIKVNPDSIYPEKELSETELAEFIRGVEENLPFMKYSQDSIKHISFVLGVMQGVFLIDGTHYQKDSIPYDCIYDGLMKVANHELTLPQDTISILEYMDSLAKVTDTIPEEENCKFYTGYGVMKGLQPGLQEYICEMTGKSQDEMPAYYESYAAGFAMMMKHMSLTPPMEESELSAYEMGVDISTEIVTQPLPFHFVKADFLDGCHAGAGFNERKITVEESDRIFSTLFPPDSEGSLKEYQKNYPD